MHFLPLETHWFFCSRRWKVKLKQKEKKRFHNLISSLLMRRRKKKEKKLNENLIVCENQNCIKNSFSSLSVCVYMCVTQNSSLHHISRMSEQAWKKKYKEARLRINLIKKALQCKRRKISWKLRKINFPRFSRVFFFGALALPPWRLLCVSFF